MTLRLMSHHLFVWSTRFAALFGSCVTLQHILQDELGYRMTLQVLLFAGLLTIVTVRLWMPWVKPKHDDEG